LRTADGRDQDIGVAADTGKVPGAGVRGGDGGVGGEQQRRHRLAEQVGAADHHGVEAGEIGAMGLADKQHGASGRAGNQAAVEISGHQLAGVDHMQPIDVLLGPDRLDHRIGIEMRGQRQLHQDAVDVGILVQRGHQRLKFGLRGVLGQGVLHRFEAALLGHAALGGDIDMGGRIIADNHHGEARPGAGLCLERRTGRTHLFDHARRDGFAVNHLRHGHPFCFPVARRRPAFRAATLRNRAQSQIASLRLLVSKTRELAPQPAFLAEP